MKKKQNKYSTDAEFEAMCERAKIQASWMKRQQEVITIDGIPY